MKHTANKMKTMLQNPMELSYTFMFNIIVLNIKTNFKTRMTAAQ